jgi:hypothetical protein
MDKRPPIVREDSILHLTFATRWNYYSFVTCIQCHLSAPRSHAGLFLLLGGVSGNAQTVLPCETDATLHALSFADYTPAPS